MLGSASAMRIHPFHGDACSSVTHAHACGIARVQLRDARAHATIRALDDRVAATEHAQRRQGVEAVFGVAEPLAARREHAGHRAVDPASVFVEALTERRHLRRRRAALDETARRDGAAPSRLEGLAGARRETAY